MITLTNHGSIAEQYLRDGVVRIREFFSMELVQGIRGELERCIRDELASKPIDLCTLEVDDSTVRNLWRLERHNDFFRTLADRPDMASLIAKLVHGEPMLRGIETFNKPARIGSGVPCHQHNA